MFKYHSLSHKLAAATAHSCCIRAIDNSRTYTQMLLQDSIYNSVDLLPYAFVSYILGDVISIKPANFFVISEKNGSCLFISVFQDFNTVYVMSLHDNVCIQRIMYILKNE